jgi:hypothetical protein
MRSGSPGKIKSFLRLFVSFNRMINGETKRVEFTSRISRQAIARFPIMNCDSSTRMCGRAASKNKQAEVAQQRKPGKNANGARRPHMTHITAPASPNQPARAYRRDGM